jgi:hypothetical protein
MARIFGAGIDLSIDTSGRRWGCGSPLIRDELQGDVKRPETKGDRYRTRIGSHHVLFILEGDRANEIAGSG